MTMLITIVPLIVLVVGLLLWALAAKPIVVKIGEYMFFCGLFVTLLVNSHYTVHIGG